MLPESAKSIRSLARQWLSATQIVQAGVGTLLLGAAFTLLFGYLFDGGENNSIFPLMVSLFAFYLFFECRIFLRNSSVLAVLSPVFLASVMHFFLAYVMPSTLALYDPWILDRFARYFVSQSEQLTESVPLIALAAFCMWRGYYAGIPAASLLRERLSNVRSLRQDLKPELMPVLVLQVIYFGLIVFAIDRGVFGIASSVANRQANLALLDLLRSGMMAGSLALFLLLTYVFQCRAAGKPERVLSVLCIVLVVLNVLTGAISGFKSQIVMPFVMLVFAKFIAVRQLSIGYILAACLALVLAYHVIEPYRAYLRSNSFGGKVEVSALIDALRKSQEQKYLVDQSSVPLASQIASRFDLTGMSAIGIAFVNGGGYTGDKPEEFAESIYLSPLLAFIPRVLWPNKPSYSSGVWFNNVVLGKTGDETTSVGMGPVTWLYLMGGGAGIAVGFFGLGILQALMFEGVARSGAGGLIIFLSAAMTLVMIPTDVGPAFTGMLRMLPLAFVAQYLLLQPDRRTVIA